MNKIQLAFIKNVAVTDESVTVDLSDGRTIIVPTQWYPRLSYGTPEERSNWRLIAKGEGINWPGLDEDLSLEGFLSGKPSYESQRSFKKWLESRKARLNKL